MMREACSPNLLRLQSFFALAGLPAPQVVLRLLHQRPRPALPAVMFQPPDHPSRTPTQPGNDTHPTQGGGRETDHNPRPVEEI